MSIEKKSLISTLKTTKKANAVSSELAKPTNVTSKMQLKRAQAVNFRAKRAQLNRATVGQPKTIVNTRRK